MFCKKRHFYEVPSQDGYHHRSRTAILHKMMFHMPRYVFSRPDSLRIFLWADFGLPLAPFGVPLGSLWPAFGVSLAVLGHLWDPFGAPWVALGRLLVFVENRTLFSEQLCRFHDTVIQNQASRNSQADLPDLPDQADPSPELLVGPPLPRALGVRMT